MFDLADIYINYGTDLPSVTYEIMKEADVRSQLRPEMRVGIKPNLVVPRLAEGGATTHPGIVEGIIIYLQDAGIKDIIILEGSWVGDNTQRAFQTCGYDALAAKYGVKLIDTKRDKGVQHSFGGLTLSLCESALGVDYLVNVPVLKGHCQTRMTCCLKNLKGCIPDSEKRRFHTLGLHQPIAALNGALRPSLHIVDSVCGDLSFEEGGDPVESNRVLLGFDPVLLDSYGAQLMGYQPDDIGYLRYAKGYGIGRYVDSNTEILELNPHNRPKVSRRPGPSAQKYGRYIEEDSACSACYAALVYALHKTGGIRDGRIKIGQGYRGRTLEGIGAGNCASGCERYVKGCPPKGSDIADMLREIKGSVDF